MIKLYKLPKKPYKSLDSFAESYGRNPETCIFWPCLKCRGVGWIYDLGGGSFHASAHPPGRSLYRRIVCPQCSGFGEWDKRKVQEVYRAALKQWRERREVVRSRNALLKSALAKLTEEEMDALYHNIKGWWYA